jgi:site-specific DNA-cytosine methylase
LTDFISCQTFAGGFDMGATKAGLRMVHKVENNGGFGIPNVDANRHLIGYDWKWQAEPPQGWETRDAPIVIGNPPCSGFSVASNVEFRGANSPINHCMWDFVDYTARVMPQIAIFESVVPAYSRKDGRQLMQNLREYLESITGEVWDLTHVKHDAHACGGCCTRRRYFWVAHRVPFRIDPTPVHEDMLANWIDAIFDLHDMPADRWEWQPYGQQTPTLWATRRVRAFNGTDGHWAPPLDDKKGTRMAILLEQEDWQPGETYEEVLKRRYDRLNGDPGFPWNEQEIADHVRRGWTSGYFPTCRWKYDKPGHVIYGGAIGNVVHPWLPRRLTHREVARAMGFPDTWKIEPLATDKGLRDYWGKGITVQAGEFIGKFLKLAVEGDVSELPEGQLVGDREWLYDVRPKRSAK